MKIFEMEKKVKDIQREADVWKHNFEELNKISN